ncbi:MAG: efflux RND transporter periplasmic adaptor subunit [Verrucomicrobiales bacterium]|nr:efflux RND transporter periplasmic adaptor subunit [Verrucomicrobiales bacterium]
MKFQFLTVFAFLAAIPLYAEDDFIALDKIGVENLGIETVEILETDFEEAFFAIGRIEEDPKKRGVVSTRVPGRVIELSVSEGDSVKKDQVLGQIESRQPGNPPPRIPLKSPLTGLVTESHIRLGEPVEPDKEMLDVIDLTTVFAVAKIPEDRADKIQIGTLARIRVPAAPGAKNLEGKLIRFGTEANSESGTIDAYFEIPNPTLRIRPGMRAEFSIITSNRKNVTSVPREALQGPPTNRYVFVKHFELPNAFVKAPVVTGQKNDRFIEIKKGVLIGDEVVTKGSYPLAFAGSGSISLKEALDAAHGHEHNDDGSEMTEEDRRRKAAERAAAAGIGTSVWNFWTTFFAASTASLLLLMILGLAMRRKGGRR